MLRSCQRCRSQFQPAASHYRLCPACYRIKVREDEEAERDRMWNEGYAAEYKQGYDEAQGLRVHELRMLIQLVHPDRHPSQRSTLANTPTAMVNRVLEQSRGRV